MVKRQKNQDRYKILFWVSVAIIFLLLSTFTAAFFYIKNKVEAYYETTTSLSRISDPSYLGLTTKQAQTTARKEKLHLRIVRNEGIADFISQDYRTDRVNISIEKGRVVKAERY